MNLRTPLTLSVLALSLAVIPGAWADQPSAVTPTESPSAVTPTEVTPTEKVLQGTVIGVKGMVQMRENDTDSWHAVHVGDVVSIGAEFRTGPRSAVQFKIPPDQIITLDRLGTVKLLDALRPDDKTVKTDLGMKYGRTDYKVESAGVEHDTTLRSPAATLAVRGTHEFSLDNTPPFEARAYSRDTMVTLTNWVHAYTGVPMQVTVGGEGTGEQEVTSADQSAADAALDGAVQDARHDSRDNTEPQLVSNFNSLAGGDLNGLNGRQQMAFQAVQDRLGARAADYVTTSNNVSIRIFDYLFDDNDRVTTSFNGATLDSNMRLYTVGSELGTPTTYDLTLRSAGKISVFTVTYVSGGGNNATVGVNLPASNSTPVDFDLTPENTTRNFLIYHAKH